MHELILNCFKLVYTLGIQTYTLGKVYIDEDLVGHEQSRTGCSWSGAGCKVSGASVVGQEQVVGDRTRLYRINQERVVEDHSSRDVRVPPMTIEN